MDFCKHRNYFGEPGTGAHSYRFLNVAIVDVIMTIVGAYLIAILINKPFMNVCIILFILGIVLHRLFCVNTTVNKLIFGVID